MLRTVETVYELVINKKKSRVGTNSSKCIDRGKEIKLSNKSVKRLDDNEKTGNKRIKLYLQMTE